MMTTSTSHKPGRNLTPVLNAWTIGWCIVVADSPVGTGAARAAYKAADKYVGYGTTPKAWPYLVNGVLCDVISDHAVSLAAAAEKGRKMADALKKHGITSRVYVMTDKQFGLGHTPGSTGENAQRCSILKGMELVSQETYPEIRHRWVLTAKQSVPVYQTSL